ncbi:MAG: fluoride efflux transporter CrcB [Opitutaceae bacterium]|jgi:fluoride exporter|nr:fluoride efflux transporter CrcB [Opitutaceae bacterium]
MISLTHLLLVGLGGGLGSIVRVLVDEMTPAGRLPWGTVAANVIGSLIIGWVLARLGPPSETNSHWQAFLAFGFCGGFTTFSSFSWQTLEQLRGGHVGIAMLHVVLSVLVCVGATWIGWRMARG